MTAPAASDAAWRARALSAFAAEALCGVTDPEGLVFSGDALAGLCLVFLEINQAIGRVLEEPGFPVGAAPEQAG